MFSQQLAKFKNETKIKTSLRARGPPGVSGALCSLRILHIGRIGSVYMLWEKQTYSSEVKMYPTTDFEEPITIPCKTAKTPAMQ